MEYFIQILQNFGISTLVVCYFLWKDKTLTKENTDIMNQVKQLLELFLEKERNN